MGIPNITAVIIAKNEEKRIAKCLESIKWADEVIVVDGFSTDKTIDIAKSYGAKVVQHKFTGAFADDRNTGNDNARNDWVLTLDADDIVTEDFRVKMEDSLSKNADIVLYKFRRKNYFLGHYMEYGGWSHYIPNLINRKFVRFEGDLHEVPVHKEGGEGVIEADIEHYPFDSIAQFVDRQNRYSSILAQDVFKKRGTLSDREIRKEMIGRSFKIFWKAYFKKKGYKEGVYGLIFAVLFAFINFMKWAKYWELVKSQK